MVANTYIGCRVDAERKARFTAVAQQQRLSESTLLKRLIDTALLGTAHERPQATGSVTPVAKGGKISVRLRSDDLRLLRERAVGRSLPTGTYVSFLIRTHLRNVAPLPAAELTALSRSVGALGGVVSVLPAALNAAICMIQPALGEMGAVAH